jgi:hypothetical protein
MQMKILEWIQQWFKNNCNGDWEHGSDMQITTLENLGWDVEIDISNTSIANLQVEWILNKKINKIGMVSKLRTKNLTLQGTLGN